MRQSTLSVALILIGAPFLLAACQPSDDSASEEAGAGDTSAEEPVAEAEAPTTEEVATTEGEPMNQAVAISELSATMKTSKGDIHLTLYADKTPITVANFVNLAQRGYYDGLTFHRVMANFMIQGGCPLGTGFGGPGYTFQDEFDPSLKHDRPGILSMANSGPGTNGSQFFITHVPTQHLDGKHSIFGSIVGPEDQEVVNAIAGGDKIETITIEGDTAPLFAATKSNLDAWNAILDK